MSASARHGAAPVTATSRQPAETGGAEYRYGVVFLLILCAVVFVIVAPDGHGSRAVTFAIVGAALLVAVWTSGEPSVVRRRGAVVGGGAIALVTVGTAAGLLPHSITLAVGAVLTVAVPATLAGGLLRLVRARRATLQAVAGALAIYLFVGLGFASAIGFVAAVGSANYFADTANSTASEHVYYSFTVLTTTGFGDLTAAHSVGRAIALVTVGTAAGLLPHSITLAVVEMLVGQLYLVTVIGILVGRRADA
jgi:Ion channel